MELTLTVRSKLLMLMEMIVIFLLFQLLLFNQLHLLAQPVQLPQDSNILALYWTMPLSSAGVVIILVSLVLTVQLLQEIALVRWRLCLLLT